MRKFSNTLKEWTEFTFLVVGFLFSFEHLKNCQTDDALVPFILGYCGIGIIFFIVIISIAVINPEPENNNA
jgi:hypothetical protein